MEKDDSEFIFAWGKSLRDALRKAGFARNYKGSGFKLLPCPPGTFVDISDTRPRCKVCPAGKLTQILCTKVAHSCIQELKTKNRFKVRELCLKCTNLRWLDAVSSTFQDVDFLWVIITTLYQLMLQSWYQKTAQSLVNTLILFL